MKQQKEDIEELSAMFKKMLNEEELLAFLGCQFNGSRLKQIVFNSHITGRQALHFLVNRRCDLKDYNKDVR